MSMMHSPLPLSSSEILRYNTPPQWLHSLLLTMPRGGNKTWLLITKVTTVCTCGYVWTYVSPTDPPHGGKGCTGTMLLHNPAPNEGLVGG